MSVLDAATGDACQIPRLDFELTPGCDHKCAHCYNVWTADEGDAQAGYDTGGQLRTPAFKAMMSDIVAQSGARHITITGGEPLVRRNILSLFRALGRHLETGDLEELTVGHITNA